MKLEQAIILAIANTEKEGLTDIFTIPFEVGLLKNVLFKEKIASEIKQRILSNSLEGLKVHSISHVLFPKKNVYDFRRAALIDPLDSIIYLSLVLMIADTIEKARLIKSQNVIFSYRFKNNSPYIFDDKNYNYTTFQNHVIKKSKSPRTKVLVKCDITSFYDRLNLHRLESTLLSINADPRIVSLLNNLLLFWANRDSYSLPIGGNASRILAEAALISVDDYLYSHKIKFCRFVDDYRFFAPDAKTAHNWLAILVDRLYLEGLTINSAKTSIEIAKKTDDTETKRQKQEVDRTRIIVGYTGTVPTKFRELSEKAISTLKEEPLDDLESVIITNEILTPDDVKKYLKVIVATKNYHKLVSINLLVEKFPQFTPYIIDILIKKSNEFSLVARKDIIKYFSSLLQPPTNLPEYILISILRLLGTEAYLSKESLMSFWRDLKRNSGAYIGRAVLDALAPNVNRTDVLEIRQYFPRADNWEKRSIIRTIYKVIDDEERRPWLKNVKIHSAADIFSIEIFSPCGAKKIKGKKKILVHD